MTSVPSRLPQAPNTDALDTHVPVRSGDAHSAVGPTDEWRLLLVDDHAITRSGIRALTAAIPGLVVAGEATTGTEALRMCAELRPDLVFMDLDLPELHGIEATRRLRERFPELPILVLTVHEQEDMVFEAIRAGASGYLSKTATMTELEDAVRAVRIGGTYMSAQMAGIAIRSLSRRAADAEEATRRPDLTTRRERQVLELLCRGQSARSIGSKLGISARTVNTHIGHLYRKLGVNNRSDAILVAVRLGIAPAR